jgi:glycine hydroxymethyltransferase
MSYVEAIDREIYDLILKEQERQKDSIRLIPSENYASAAVIEATGTLLCNKYSEGYPGDRYYQGQEFIDQIETIAINRAKALFGADHVNVQPYSGSPANMAVYSALLEPGDKILGMDLFHGGHLSHGWKINYTAKMYKPCAYPVDPESGMINYDTVRKTALEVRPKMIIAGASTYSRIIDFAAFADIAREVGAYLFTDIAHISGLVVAGVHPSPVPHADVVSTTTHKTLRGPRGGMILCKAEHAKKIDKAVFPHLQGGPHDHTTAAIAVALKEAATPEFSEYAKKIVENAKILAAELMSLGFDIVSGGTDNHLMLIDLRNKELRGKPIAQALEEAGIVTCYNTVPFDNGSPKNPRGIRIGTPAVTSRGFGPAEMKFIAAKIDEVVKNSDNPAFLSRTKAEVTELCQDFPVPGLMIK